jgi:serine protease
MKPLTNRHIAAACCAVALNLTGCGGGGGDEGGNSTPPPANGGTPLSYTISGKVAIAETAAIDNDTNDPIASYVDNDDFDKAQAINNPTLVTGHLTFKGQAASGPNNDNGDTSDVFKTRLIAGQVVELEFASPPEDIDIDLFIFDGSRKLVGQSIGENRYECIRIATTGDYFINADVYTATSVGDTTYQLRISSPDTGGACSTVTADSGPNIVPNSVITIAKPSSGLVGKELITAPIVTTQTVPDGAISALNQQHLSTKSVTKKSLGLKPQGTLHGYKIAEHQSIDSASRNILRTVAHAKALRASGNYEATSVDTYVYPTQAAPIVGALPSNDTYYSRQRWHYEMISLPAAMATLNSQSPRPTRRPIVAVIDTGVVYDHPDLRANLLAGYDFISEPSSAGDGDSIDGNADDSSPARSNEGFHGTHVSGTVAAISFNGIGGAGVAPMAQIIPIRVLGSGNSRLSDVLQGMLFAAGLANNSTFLPATKADIINMSLGGSGSCDSVLQGVVDRVRAAGVVIVAASGNDSKLGSLVPVSTPANCNGVISVGAVDASRQRSGYSNGGAGLTLVAPGGDLNAATTGNGLPDGIFSLWAEWRSGVRQPGYTAIQGTSMASPHVAGVLALMKWANPALTGAQIEALIKGGTITDDVGAPGKDSETGAGLINAKRAVDAAIAAVTAPGVTPPPPAAGKIEASPSIVGFGSVRTTVDVVVQKVGTVNDRITSVTSSSPAVLVGNRAGAIDANGLGTYTIIVDRAKMAAGPLPSAKVTFNTLTGSIVIPVSAEKRTSAVTGNAGPMYVLIIDADSADENSIAEQAIAVPVGGFYSYSITVSGTTAAPPARNIQVYAGTDLDNDGSICSRGESCGAYPIIDSSAQILPLTKSYTGIDFTASTLGGITAASLGTKADQRAGLIRPPRKTPITSKVSK